MNKKTYQEDSIVSLSPLEFTRLRPGVYCGSTEYSTQLLVEIISNSIDEFKAGHGKRIEVVLDNKENSCMVRDYGQGFLINSKRKDGKTVLQAAFDTLNTSGKFSEDGVYEGTALGLNGIGGKLVNFLSHKMEVETFRDGMSESIFFLEGVFQNRHISKVKEPNGTYVRWQPSEEFFTHVEVELPKIKKLFHTLVCLCPGLEILLTVDDNPTIRYYSIEGINDLIDDIVTPSKPEIINSRMNINYINGKNQLDMAMTYTTNYSLNMISYVNTGETDSGPHITQIKTILTREFNKFFKEKKWLKDKDENLSGEDLQEGMLIIFNITTSGVSYDAQTKSRIVKIDMTPFSTVISENVRKWIINNEKDIKLIFDKAFSARKAREAAKKARDLARKPKGKGLKAKMEISDKFTDCVSKDPANRNLMLVEGSSAAGSVLESRNVNTDCIYRLRGKVLSVLKCDEKKIFENQELSDIIKVIGAGFGQSFNVEKMNFNKIVITSDQDSDGMAIELLLITFFFTYMRPLVEAGKLYRAVTPLYIVTTKKEKYYCYTEEELEQWKNTHTESYELMHIKGLGEISASVLKEICFDNQKFKRITVSDAAATEKLLQILEGPDVAPRKQYIYNNATRMGFNFT